MSISVVYWSGTGNTQAMAEAIGEGIESAGAQANVISVDQANVEGAGRRRCVCPWLLCYGS